MASSVRPGWLTKFSDQSVRLLWSSRFLHWLGAKCFVIKNCNFWQYMLWNNTAKYFIQCIWDIYCCDIPRDISLFFWECFFEKFIWSFIDNQLIVHCPSGFGFETCSIKRGSLAGLCIVVTPDGCLTSSLFLVSSSGFISSNAPSTLIHPERGQINWLGYPFNCGWPHGREKSPGTICRLLQGLCAEYALVWGWLNAT